MEILSFFAHWTPVVSAVTSIVDALRSPDTALTAGAGAKWLYDTVAALKGLEVMANWGAGLAARTGTKADDRFFAWLKAKIGQGLHMAGRFTTPGVKK